MTARMPAITSSSSTHLFHAAESPRCCIRRSARTASRHGGRALERVGAATYDLITMDHFMAPSGGARTGAETIAELRELSAALKVRNALLLDMIDSTGRRAAAGQPYCGTQRQSSPYLG